VVLKIITDQNVLMKSSTERNVVL